MICEFLQGDCVRAQDLASLPGPLFCGALEDLESTLHQTLQRIGKIEEMLNEVLLDANKESGLHG